MKTNNITQSALSLALIVICFLLFRGVTNILNSILVPLVLYLNIRGQSWKVYITTMLGLVLLSILFFKHQIIFSILYGILALLLLKTIKGKKPFLIKVSILSIGAWVGFITAILVTDFILGTKIMTALLSIAGGLYAGVIVLIAVEALIVGTLLVLITPTIENRLDKTQDIRERSC